MLKSTLFASLLVLTPSLALAAPHNSPSSAAASPPAEKHNSKTQTAHGKTQGHGWSYIGENGPEHWGEYDPEAVACKVGNQQSPIDLRQPINAFVSTPQIDWHQVHKAELVNNGHTLQVNLQNAGGIVHGDKLYKLIQFHFHTPSEHTIDGRHFPMEAHFVHQAKDGTLAVIGVMFAEGANNPRLDPIWWAAPSMEGKAAVSFELAPTDLLPKNHAAMRYQGSLTTPPCSEIVDWTVLTTPINASKSQITVFKSMFGDNARPIQPVNRRFVLATPQ
ncbi:MAG: carbonate dehydratase [Hirschia sp.]|nr:carbonate dehydratase [Hirschia sp.]MBF18104.1 carbonate dehydratase [Hirschia sp.]